LKYQGPSLNAPIFIFGGVNLNSYSKLVFFTVDTNVPLPEFDLESPPSFIIYGFNYQGAYNLMENWNPPIHSDFQTVEGMSLYYVDGNEDVLF
jgi:hypothetical protein